MARTSRLRSTFALWELEKRLSRRRASLRQDKWGPTSFPSGAVHVALDAPDRVVQLTTPGETKV